jgi:hypothetical protein
MMLAMMGCQAKVTQFHIIVLVKEHILGLQISMDQAHFMEIMKGINNLREYFPLQIV